MGSCCSNGDATWTLFRSKTRKAKKQHKCCECGDAIKPNEEYQYVAGLFEGSWFHYDTCTPCEELRASLDGVECVYFNGLSEAYQNYLESVNWELSREFKSLSELHAKRKARHAELS